MYKFDILPLRGDRRREPIRHIEGWPATGAMCRSQDRKHVRSQHSLRITWVITAIPCIFDTCGKLADGPCKPPLLRLGFVGRPRFAMSNRTVIIGNERLYDFSDWGSLLPHVYRWGTQKQ